LQTLRASKCGLSTSQLSPAILDIIDSLTKAGYDAYIVGGGVRDLMLGEHPKDFDAVTNATPAQIKQVFGRRCRIIGRRFELAHVHSGREMIEVATFRAPPKKAVTSSSGMILRDNNWGTIEQDFARRDFTINSMYYQPRDGIVLDFCNAYSDIQNKKLKLLGDARQRFEEDPVRMLRTLRFAAKLGFQIDQSILKIFDEALKESVTTSTE
jgi:poly(A) polymerase